MNRKSKIALAAMILMLLIFTPAISDEQEPENSQASMNSSSALPNTSANEIIRTTEASRNPASNRTELQPSKPVALSELTGREKNMLSRSDEGLRAQVLPNGAVVLNLRGRFQNMATAATDQNTGQLIKVCSIGDDTHHSEAHHLKDSQ